MPAWISPAFLILWAPGGFRVTCYYYRKAYYRAFFLDPVGCAVGEPSSFCGFRRGREYKGETRLLIFQNLHRYFLYLALIFLALLAFDVVLSCRWPDGFGVSVGTLVLAVNVALLTLYTTSCHSFRHLVGGRLDRFSATPLRPAPLPPLVVGDGPEQEPHALGLGQPVLGRVRRLLRLAGRLGHDHGLSGFI